MIESIDTLILIDCRYFQFAMTATKLLGFLCSAHPFGLAGCNGYIMETLYYKTGFKFEAHTAKFWINHSVLTQGR